MCHNNLFYLRRNVGHLSVLYLSWWIVVSGKEHDGLLLLKVEEMINKFTPLYLRFWVLDHHYHFRNLEDIC